MLKIPSHFIAGALDMVPLFIHSLHILQLIFVIVAVTTSRVSVKEMCEDEILKHKTATWNPELLSIRRAVEP